MLRMRIHRKDLDGKHLCNFTGTVRETKNSKCPCGVKVLHPRVDDAPKYWAEAGGAKLYVMK